MMFNKIKNHIYYSSSKDFDESLLCRYIGIVGQVKDIDRGDWYCELEYLNPEDEMQTVLVNPSLKERELLNLASKGADISSVNVRLIIEYLSKQKEEITNVRYAYSHLGWNTSADGNLLFNNQEFPLFKYDSLIGTHGENKEVSDYFGKLDLKSKGSMEDWSKFMKNYISDYPNLQLAVILGASAPILRLIMEVGDIENLIVHICGKSSSGKTTALMLAMSLWGNPSGSNSLIRQFNTTKNALLKQLTNESYQGFPCAYDEVGMGIQNFRDLTGLIYQLSAGTDKSRCSKNLDLQESKTFKTVILTTGEIRLTDYMNGNELGSSVIRIIECNDISWCVDAEQSKKIKAFVSSNYGLVAKEFIKSLMDYSYQDLVDRWREESKLLLNRIETPIGEYSTRLSDRFAILMTTFVYFCKIFELNWNYNDFFEVIVNLILDKKESIDYSSRIYDLVVKYVLNHRSKFYDTTEKGRMKNFQYDEVYGKITNNEYIIEKGIFNSLLKSSGFNNVSVALHEMLKKGMITPEKSGNKQLVYNRRVLFPNEPMMKYVVIKKKCTDESDDYIEKNITECSAEKLFEDDYFDKYE